MYRWQLGAALPEHAAANASAHEVGRGSASRGRRGEGSAACRCHAQKEFFLDYTRILGQQMAFYDLDLTRVG